MGGDSHPVIAHNPMLAISASWALYEEEEAALQGEGTHCDQ